MNEHWATPLIGLPWVYGGRGPEDFDCWGLVCYVQRTHFQIEMPNFDAPKDWFNANVMIETHEERRNWTLAETGVDGDVVLMSRSRFPVHIGVVVQAGNRSGILHCLQNVGVIYQPETAMRGSGWGGLAYYRHHTCQPQARNAL
jgi:cell wall-associated NlpC family hydrolase